MRENFVAAHQFTAKWEGGLSDHPADGGGLTAYGASLAFVGDLAKTAAGKNFLRQIGVGPLPVCRETILSLSRAQAAAMFEREFWTKLDLDALDGALAAVIYDGAVNCGPARSVKFAQRAANKIRNARLVCDGILGPLSKAALAKPDAALLLAMCGERKDYCRAIVKNRPSQQVFLKGWLNRVNALEKFALYALAQNRE